MATFKIPALAVGLVLLVTLAACNRGGGSTQNAATGAPQGNQAAATENAAPAAHPAAAAQSQPTADTGKVEAPAKAGPEKAAEDVSVTGMVNEAAASAKESSTHPADDAQDQVANALSDYLIGQGAPPDGGVANKGGVSVQFATGTATAAVPPGSAQFTDARNLAFEQAYQRALGAVAFARTNRVTSLILSKLFQDTSNKAALADACKPSASEVAQMKVRQLADAALNTALRKLDVPDEDIDTSKPVFHCENPLTKDAIDATITDKALESMKGVRIVKSVQVGQEVGVAVAVSPNFVAAAQAMARQETARNPLPTAMQEISAALQASKGDQLFAEYGTRAVKLSNGELAVFAFGQAGANLSTSDVGGLRSIKRRAAQSAARLRAESQLAQFAKVTTYFAGNMHDHADLTEALEVNDGVASDDTSQNVGRKLFEDIRSSASLQLQGAMVVKHWSMDDPESGDKVEGVVLAWSPSLAGTMQQAGRAADNGPAANQQVKKVATKLRQSAERKEDW